MKTSVNLKNIDSSLLIPVSDVLAELGIEISDDSDIAISVRKSDKLSVDKDNQNILITYSRQNEIFRALSYIPRIIDDGNRVEENAKYSLLCYMADCSRNAVYNMPTVKKMLRCLAIMGYDSMMLYTEDTFELPEYKYFGHMRGRFSEAELREIDDYAYSLGIELIPCVQTLAHLATALRWPDFAGYKDNGDILLVGDDRTYKFIDAIISQCAKCFRSRRINIGMDEAHELACGEYLRKNGYRNPSDVMLEHLSKVVNICSEHGFKPMMWSDMFFRMAFRTYYVSNGDISPDVIAKVPSEVELVYWDYYSTDEALVNHMAECHKKFNNNIVFAGGAWKWDGWGTQNHYSLKATKVQLDACDKFGIDQIIVTAWGDNGGEASQFSVLASMLYYAERCYTDCFDEKSLDERAKTCFGTSFEDMLAFDLPNKLPGCEDYKGNHPASPAKYLLFNDPLERLLDCHVKPESAPAAYAEHAKVLHSLECNERFGYAYRTLALLCDILAIKSDMGHRLYAAYQAGDRDALAYIANEQLPELSGILAEFIEAFRYQWYRENKAIGFLAQDIRLGGLAERLRSVKQRIDMYLMGEIASIEELEYEALPVNPKENGGYIPYRKWNPVVASGLL